MAHIIAATALTEGDEPAGRRQVSRAAPSPEPSRVGLEQSGTSLVDRNMFCSRCAPEPPAAGAASQESAPGDRPLTELPLRLIATSLAPLDARSFATVRNTTTAYQGAFRVGERIPGVGVVTRIVAGQVDFENEASRRIERVSLFTPRPAAPAAVRPPVLPARPAPPAARADRSELQAAIGEGIRALDADSFEVDRALLGKLLANPAAASRGARIVPSVKDGRPNGFTLRRVRPGSLYAQIGLQTGDTIHAVNGLELRSVDQALQVYTQVRDASRLTVAITRRGVPMTFDYTVR